jgi:hypothetical protein
MVSFTELVNETKKYYDFSFKIFQNKVSIIHWGNFVFKFKQIKQTLDNSSEFCILRLFNGLTFVSVSTLKLDPCN